MKYIISEPVFSMSEMIS